MQSLSLLLRQTRRELDSNADHKVSPFAWLFALGHAEVGIPFCPCWSCGPVAADAELFAVDCGYGAPPAGECFFEVEVDGAFDVVAVAGEEGVWFLWGWVSD